MNDIYEVISSASEKNNTVKNEFDKSAWMQRKKDEKDGAYKMIEDTALSLKEAPSFKTYLEVQSRLDKYSVGNALLIMAQRPNATKLKDFDAWKEIGSGVRPKQKGIVILEPSGEYVRKDGSTAVNYNLKKVFDVSQTSTNDKAITKTHDERTVLKALISNTSVPIKVVESFDNSNVAAIYDDKEKAVFVRKGLSNAEFFKSISEELAHATFAKSDNYSRGQSSFKAECVSYMLCKKYGVENNELPNISAGFKNQDSDEIRNDLNSIRKVMNDINDRMRNNLEQNKSVKSKEAAR